MRFLQGPRLPVSVTRPFLVSSWFQGLRWLSASLQPESTKALGSTRQEEAPSLKMESPSPLLTFHPVTERCRLPLGSLLPANNSTAIYYYGTREWILETTSRGCHRSRLKADSLSGFSQVSRGQGREEFPSCLAEEGRGSLSLNGPAQCPFNGLSAPGTRGA